MSVKYTVTLKRNVYNGKNEVKYYAVSKRNSIKTTDEIKKNLEKKSTLSRADMSAAIVAITDEIIEQLLSGHSVRLDGLGIFSLVVTSDGYKSEEEVEPRRVRISRVRFLPATSFKKQLREVSFENDRKTNRKKKL